MNGYKRGSQVVDDAPPLDSGLAKVDQKREVEPGSLQVVDTLGQVFVGQLLDALDPDQLRIVTPFRQVYAIGRESPIPGRLRTTMEPQALRVNRGRGRGRSDGSVQGFRRIRMDPNV